HVVAARLGQHRAELGEAHRAEQRVQTSGEPQAKNDRRVRDLTGDETGRAQDPDAERAADDDHETEADAENASQGRTLAPLGLSLAFDRAHSLGLQYVENRVDRLTAVARRVAPAGDLELDM